jgi:hypothetical protein
VLNDFHSGACGKNLSLLDTSQKILRAGYFHPMIFKDCVEVVKRYHPFQMFSWKMHMHHTPLFLIVIVDPFKKWRIYFITFHLPLTKGNCYIIVVIDYFTKWVEAMPTFANDGETTTLFLFNQVMTRFGLRRDIFTDHVSHF